MIKKTAGLGVVLLFLLSVISCEKDFTDIGSSVINNGVFDTKDTLLDITIESIDISELNPNPLYQSIRADGGITALPPSAESNRRYLLGIFNRDQYKKIDASIVSQLLIPSNLNTTTTLSDGETIGEKRFDDVILRIPLQVTRKGTKTAQIEVNGILKDTIVPDFKLDSLLGDPTKEFTVKVYQNGTFLNSLNPGNPTQNNSYQSNETYEKIGDELNTNTTFKFEGVENDTLFIFDRSLSTGGTYKDTLKIPNGTVTSNPFIAIKLDKARLKTLLFDQYQSGNLASQESFNNYFRGLIIEVTGENGAIVPLSLANSTLRPSLDIIHTSTIFNSDNTVKEEVETINSFNLGGISNYIYTPTNAQTPVSPGTFAVQGTAGTMANINILQGTQLQKLANKNWLINDASLIFYIEKSKDTLYTPRQLFLFKNEANNPSQIKDLLTEGTNTFGGTLVRDDNGVVDRYHFRITDYISDLLSGESSYNPPLGLRVFNATDSPANALDTIVRSYNWNPRGVVLHGNTSTNTARKAQLKISYSIKK